MAAKFYYSDMASRPLVIDGHEYKFDPAGIIAGRMTGSLAVENPDDIARLDRAVANRAGVREIPRSDYDILQAKKKAIPISASSSNLSRQPPIVVPPPLSMQGKTAVESAAGAGKPRSEEKPSMLEPEKVIVLDRVNPPQLSVPNSERVKIAEPKSKRKQ